MTAGSCPVPAKADSPTVLFYSFRLTVVMSGPFLDGCLWSREGLSAPWLARSSREIRVSGIDETLVFTLVVPG